eukprot:ANDGO_01208.mRNA.1 DNA-directed RNA polymerase II subunit rpb4
MTFVRQNIRSDTTDDADELRFPGIFGNITRAKPLLHAEVLQILRNTQESRLADSDDTEPATSAQAMAMQDTVMSYCARFGTIRNTESTEKMRKVVDSAVREFGIHPFVAVSLANAAPIHLDEARSLFPSLRGIDGPSDASLQTLLDEIQAIRSFA